MFKIDRSKKRKLVILAIILIVASAVYLNRAYSHIYKVLGNAKLEPIDGRISYLISGTKIANSMSTSSLVYVALGDSLTAGAGTDNYSEILPYILAKKFSAKGKEVILQNRSAPGIETAGIITDYLSLAISDKPDIITLLIGVNDIHNEVSVANFTKNYEEILSRLKQDTGAEIYAINLPFLGADTLMSPPYQSIFDAQTREFNEVIKTLADKYSVKYIDLYTPTVDLFKRRGDHYSKDLFHPSASGYKLWADIIYDSLNQ